MAGGGGLCAPQVPLCPWNGTGVSALLGAPGSCAAGPAAGWRAGKPPQRQLVAAE